MNSTSAKEAWKPFGYKCQNIEYISQGTYIINSYLCNVSVHHLCFAEYHMFQPDVVTLVNYINVITM